MVFGLTLTFTLSTFFFVSLIFLAWVLHLWVCVGLALA